MNFERYTSFDEDIRSDPISTPDSLHNDLL